MKTNRLDRCGRSEPLTGAEIDEIAIGSAAEVPELRGFDFSDFDLEALVRNLEPTGQPIG